MKKETHAERVARKQREFEMAVKRTMFSQGAFAFQILGFCIALVTLILVLKRG